MFQNELRFEKVKTNRLRRLCFFMRKMPFESWKAFGAFFGIKKPAQLSGFLLSSVTSTGFKPVTFWAVIRCAIQLRHEAVVFARVRYDLIAGANIVRKTLLARIFWRKIASLFQCSGCHIITPANQSLLQFACGGKIYFSLRKAWQQPFVKFCQELKHNSGEF